MKFKTVSASAFKSVFEVLKDIINDVNIVFTSDGMRILTLDHAHVAMVDMYLPSENFENYTCDSKIIAGINIINMYKVLKNISGTDNTLTMEITTNEYLDILIENPSRKTKTRLKLLDIDENDIEEPQIKMDITTVLPSSEFQRICRDMRQLNENGNVTITRDNNKFKIAIEGDFANQETIIDCPQSQFKGNISALYDLGYLNTFTKASGICASVQIMQEFRNRFLILKYNVANLGELVFYLSSKVTGESDED
jgi:proliferating cell nuclear antigen